ncbi:hypothetical protein [Leucobacter aridicollis]|uniref:DUF1648 domain-containing protein n=1 Tax=Leucobacter aridicollis TaxID=283878 RepID=A0A852R106_9MICO|nr:hypothetical protein [Leucobacter aridicollis]MBL3683137.1 hypothetical protein [Leucobacter aridicollis]NYD25365.1 hypothetical protein [Leucobacter aridicollis]
MATIVFPSVLSLLTAGTVVWLMPLAPEGVVMQWWDGRPSRYASPAELLVMPACALLVIILGQVAARAWNRREARLGLAIVNGVNATLNVFAVSLLVGQLEGSASKIVPVIAIGISFLAGVLVAVGTFLSTRE